MTPNSKVASEVATDAARRFWARVAGDSAPEEVALVAELAHTELRAGLGRWIGIEGYRALLDRALARAEAEHPALGTLAFLGGDQPVTTAAERARGAAEVAAAMVALVAALIDSLGRIIGKEMALRLVEQIGTPGPHDAVSTDTEGGRNG